MPAHLAPNCRFQPKFAVGTTAYSCAIKRFACENDKKRKEPSSSLLLRPDFTLHAKRPLRTPKRHVNTPIRTHKYSLQERKNHFY